VVSPKQKRRAFEAIKDKLKISKRSLCKILGLQQSTLFYKSRRRRDDSFLKEKILEIAQRKVRYGRPRVTFMLRERMGIKANHKRIARVYRELGLQVNRRSGKKKRCSGKRLLFVAPTGPNQIWAMDFVSDSLATGRRFRTLNIKDLFTHEAVAIHVDFSISSDRVAEILSTLKSKGKCPKSIVLDNGTEFTAKAMDQWAYQNQVELNFIQPGKPIQNAFIESFNDKFRSECLNLNWFESIFHAKEVIESWRVEYNTDRPNSALKNKTPEMFAKMYEESLREANQP
jgi:putative transposase